MAVEISAFLYCQCWQKCCTKTVL